MTAATDNVFQPDYAVAPGETLLEMLENRGMTQTELARRLGVSLKHVNGVVRGAAPISANLALGLEKVVGPSADFWLNREGQYRADLARGKEAHSLSSGEAIAWAASYPVRELKAAGVFDKDAKGATLVSALLRFLGVAEPGMSGTPVVAFRKSTKFDSDDRALDAWLRVGEIKASEIPCAEYDPARFRAALAKVRLLTPLGPEEWGPEVVKLCASAGVAVVIVDTFKGAKVNGATRWLSPTRALLQLSLRGRYEDIFWFTFFHEAGHILLHAKKPIFIEKVESKSRDVETKQGDTEWRRLEAEADDFAAKMLIPPGHDAELQTLTVQDIPRFAARLGIAPAIVLGRLQHEGRIPWNQGHQLKRPFQLSGEGYERA